MAEAADTNICPACKGTSFYTESGFFYCTQCLTQVENANEQVFETKFDETTRMRVMKIRTEKKVDKDVIGWTSWEFYNFAMIGIVNELIKVGVDPDIKLTLLQLWTYYLSKLEVAFTSKTKRNIPRMARRYRKKDAEIIYGKFKEIKKKRRRRRGSSNASTSMLSSSVASSGSASRKEFMRSQQKYIAEHNEAAKSLQQSSDTDLNSSMNQSLQSLQSSFSKTSSNGARILFNKRARKEAKLADKKSKVLPHGKRNVFRKTHVSYNYAVGPDSLKPSRLWALAYLALRLLNQKIYLSDMLRFSKENHFTLYKISNLIPPEVKLTKSDVSFLTHNMESNHEKFRRRAYKLARFLDITELPKPDILGLIKRYCEDLELPKGIMQYAQKLYLSSPCEMDFKYNSLIIPNYEGRAMAYIIVVMKILFGLDDVTEKEIGRVIGKINKAAAEREILSDKLFNFLEWQEFIECRKTILASTNFPSKLKYDPEGTNGSHLYLRFSGLMKRDGEPLEYEKRYRDISQTLLATMDQCVNALNDNDIPLKEMVMFPPSLTPLKSYITQLDENSHIDVPYVLLTKFAETKVGYVTKPDRLVELAAQCDISLKVVDSSAHYLEKIVPCFGTYIRMSANVLIEPVKIETPKYKPDQRTKLRDHVLEYTYRKRECKMKINSQIFDHYSFVRNKELTLEETLDFEEDSFFDKVLPDGRLDIDEASDSEDEESADQTVLDSNAAVLNEEFFKRQRIELFSHELKTLPKKSDIVKNVFYKERDAKSKDVQDVKKEYKRISVPAHDSSADETEAKSETKQEDADNSSQVEDSFDLSKMDISILDEDVTFVNETRPENDENGEDDIEDEDILFRPYKDFWMYHCNFSQICLKSFSLMEKELPENFVWLLNECADMLEMPPSDLYQEVCLVESYHLNDWKVKPKDSDEYYSHDINFFRYGKRLMRRW